MVEEDVTVASMPTNRHVALCAFARSASTYTEMAYE
jgi:hypothetical protein